MFNRRTLTIIKRELQTKLLSRTFILMTILVPLFMIGIIGLQTLFVSMDGDSNTILKVYTEDESLIPALVKEFNETEAVKQDGYKISVESLPADELQNTLADSKNDLLDNKLTGIVFISKEALSDKSIQYYSKNPNNNSIFNKIRNSINTVLIDKYFQGKDFTEDEISFARKNVWFKGFRVSQDENIEEEGYGNQILA